jgi:hypothetical protein
MLSGSTDDSGFSAKEIAFLGRSTLCIKFNATGVANEGRPLLEHSEANGRRGFGSGVGCCPSDR